MRTYSMSFFLHTSIKVYRAVSHASGTGCGRFSQHDILCAFVHTRCSRKHVTQ